MLRSRNNRQLIINPIHAWFKLCNPLSKLPLANRTYLTAQSHYSIVSTDVNVCVFEDT